MNIRNDNITRIPQSITILKEEKEVYLYGDGDYAKRVLEEIKKWGISVQKILVSKGRKKTDFFENIEVCEFDDFIKEVDKPIVIIAGYRVFVHKELNQVLYAHPNVKKIYDWSGCDTLYCTNFEGVGQEVTLLDNYYVGLIDRKLDYDYYRDNEHLFQETYGWLHDDKSKRVMKKYLDGHVNLAAFPCQSEWSKEDVANQYFPEDIVQLSNHEMFVDCGAYTGDTLLNFCNRVESFEKYYALEPDERRKHDIEQVISQKKSLGEIEWVKLGAWSEKSELHFSTERECGELTHNQTEYTVDIPVDSIDHIVDINEKVTFIKMDIEGAELQALTGAANVIKRNKPVLAICVYHKREDLITIPQYIKELVPEYEFYLRCHYPYASELVLYAKVRK